MKNPSLYIGFTLVSEEEDGHLRVSTFDGLSYQGLDDLQATMVQDLLVSEFAEEFDTFKQKIRSRMVDIGYAVQLNGGAEAAEIDAGRNLVHGKAKPKPA